MCAVMKSVLKLNKNHESVYVNQQIDLLLVGMPQIFLSNIFLSFFNSLIILKIAQEKSNVLFCLTKSPKL